MDWRDSLLLYLREQLPAAEAIRFARFSGMPAGASNETLGIDLGVTCEGDEHTLKLVFRPQRHDGILAPYDVGRQYRVMRGLASTDVLVPAVFWYEPGPDIVGMPFFFMSRLTGETLPLFWYGGRSKRVEAVAAALASVHQVDWRRAGLNFLLPEGAGQRESTPIETELLSWRSRGMRFGLEQQERFIRLGEFLRANEPGDARFALLHGDPNPGNYLVHGDEVVAVLDWELAAIGNPRSDLGFYAALLTIFGGMPGRGGRTLLSDAYEDVTGQRLTSLDYYEAAGLYKMAVITAGWGGISGFGYGLELIARRLDALLGPRWGT